MKKPRGSVYNNDLIRNPVNSTHNTTITAVAKLRAILNPGQGSRMSLTEGMEMAIVQAKIFKPSAMASTIRM